MSSNSNLFDVIDNNDAITEKIDKKSRMDTFDQFYA